MATLEYKKFLGDNAAEIFFTQVFFTGLFPAMVWFAPDHVYALFLQGRPLDGFSTAGLYGLVFLTAFDYYRAEWENLPEETLRWRYVLRVGVFLGSLIIDLLFVPSGLAINLAQSVREGNATVFLSKRVPSPGETVGAMLRLDFPKADLCDVTEVQLHPNAAAPGVTVFSQEGFSLDSDNNYFYSLFYGGCSCRFGFRVPEGFDREDARFRITYKMGTKGPRPFIWDVIVTEGSVVREVPLYSPAIAR